jgi:hypothetical protein
MQVLISGSIWDGEEFRSTCDVPYIIAVLVAYMVQGAR